MKKVLYVSNIEVPYRTEFFNQFSKYCNLTVLYEREKSSNRDELWSKSKKSNFKIQYLNGIKIKNEYALDIKILRYVFSKKFDKIILGCYNSPSQMLAIILLKLFHKKYYLNIDGEYFIGDKGIKNKIKRFFIKGACSYFIAGEQSAMNLKKIVNCSPIIPYYFSSLTDYELEQNKNNKNNNKNDCILVIGQYFDYKGLDIALQVAKKNQNLKYKFIGMGNKTNLFLKNVNDMNLSNVEVTPFLSKKELYNEYRNCKLLLLPSKKECWGLVINEAASFGTPIISTDGSGAAIEFLARDYPQFLAESGNADDIYNKIINLFAFDEVEEYKNYLIGRSQAYSIEKSVQYHLNIINIDN